jgi:hypothetical protein
MASSSPSDSSSGLSSRLYSSSTDYDPILQYRLSDRLRDQRTFYLVVGLWAYLGGISVLMMVFH